MNATFIPAQAEYRFIRVRLGSAASLLAEASFSHGGEKGATASTLAKFSKEPRNKTWISAFSGMAGFCRDCLRAVAIAMAILLALAPYTAHGAENTQHKIVEGLSIYIGVLPAEMLLSHPKEHHEREMHGGVPAGYNRYHVVVALFDAASGKRITQAQVKIGGASIGMAAARKKAEPMLVNNLMTYGNYVTLPGQGPYRLVVEIQHPARGKPVEVEFEYPFARS